LLLGDLLAGGLLLEVGRIESERRSGRNKGKKDKDGSSHRC